MTWKLDKAIKLATQAFKDENGEEAKIEDGERFVTVFNDGILILGMEDRTFKVEVLAGEPYRIDFDLDLLEKRAK